MIQIGIVDDMEFEQNKLISCLLKYEDEKGVSFDLHAFRSSEAFLKTAPKKLDVLFLDIAMDGMDGMELARQIRLQNSRIIIVFITSMIQYAVEGYSVNALDFIVKPISYDSLKLRLDRIMAKLIPKTVKHLEIKTTDGIYYISTEDVCYLEAYNHRVRLHTRDQVLPVNRTLNSMQNDFRTDNFFRCHASFLVNLNYVEKIQGNDIWVCGDMLSVSRQKKKEFMNVWTEFVRRSI